MRTQDTKPGWCSVGMGSSCRHLSLAMLCLMLAACGSPLRRPVVDRGEAPVAMPSPTPAARPATVPAPVKAAPILKHGGGFYQDDGPGESPPSPEFLAAIPDAEPRFEPLHRFANKPYSVLGRDYVPMTALVPYKASGVASWYGRKFHGQKTSSGEIYDMYGMTAAHATLPIPSFVRVTNPANGRTVVVRVNDRGPFHAGRLIDLSYAAAWKLDYIGTGSTLVEVETALPGSTLLATRAPAAAPADDALADLVQRVEQAAAQRPAMLPEVKEARGIFLQLGAFGNADNAEILKNRLGRELSGLLNGADPNEKLVVQARGGIHRVQLGPWPDQAAAERIAERLREAFEIKPVLVRQ